MQSDWLDATLHISPDESRLLNWMEAPTLPDEEMEKLYILTNLEDCDIIDIENEERR